MTLKIGTILDYRFNRAHADHIHVEGPTKYTGTPPTTNPGMSPGVKAIYDALTKRFGKGAYFLDKNGRYVGNDPGIFWTHMGGWNRRYIEGKTIWTQHSWWNALDLGPYINEAQKPFYDFLTGKEIPMGFQDIGHLPQATQDAIKRIASEGIANGTSATTFAPNEPVTRWQMALFLDRLRDAAPRNF